MNGNPTYTEIITVLTERRDGFRWKRSQLKDERRDLMACPEDAGLIPEVVDELIECGHHIDELDYLIEQLYDLVDELRLEDEYFARYDEAL